MTVSIVALDVIRFLWMHGPMHVDDVPGGDGRLQAEEAAMIEAVDGWYMLTERGARYALKMGMASVKRLKRWNDKT
jgi:hypothetical protein